MSKRNFWTQKDLQGKTSAAGGWQIVYTGFVLILLCFFIMLTSFASLEQSKITRFARSFSNAVSVFSGGRSLESGQTMINTPAMVVDKEDPVALLFEKVKMLGAEQDISQVTISRSKRGVIMTLAEKMLFESGDAAISPSSRTLLKKISYIINKLDVYVDIEGHTDDKPIQTQKYPSNWELSTTRAVNVLRFLIAEGRAKPKRLSAVGFSQYHPVAANTSMENRGRNRRVEIIFRPESP